MKRAIVVNAQNYVTGFWIAPDTYAGPYDAAGIVTQVADDLGVPFFQYVGGVVSAIPSATRQSLIDAITAAKSAAATVATEREDFLRKLILFGLNHENRIRTLEGKATITREQFVAAVRNL